MAKISFLLFGGILSSSLFFTGRKLESLSLTLILIFSLLLCALWLQRRITIPKGPLALGLLLFWGWLGITLLWSPVPYLSALSFWWLGAMPLSFFLYNLEPDRERLWRILEVLLFAIGLSLAVSALYQLLILKAPPQGSFLDKNSLAAFLNPIILILSGKFLTYRKSRKDSAYFLLICACLTLLLHINALIASRSAFIGITFGFILLFTYALSSGISRLRIYALALIFIISIYSGNFYSASQNDLPNRLMSLSEPTQDSSASERILILKGSLEMLKEEPLWGIGLGTYFLAWPPFRHIRDHSAGQHVHNDYLEIWIEAGLPALLFLVFILTSTLFIYIRSIKKSGKDIAHNIELTSLVCGVIALFINSLFQYNFYTFPILILAGLILGRLYFLACPRVEGITIFLRPFMKTIISIALLFPMIFFASMWTSSVKLNKGMDEMRAGKWMEANQAFASARRIWPSSDGAWYVHAEFFRRSLNLLEDSNLEDRHSLFNKSFELLAEAEKRNPLRPQIFSIRGSLYQENPDLVSNGRTLAKQEFLHALALDPNYVNARMGLARLYLSEGYPKESLAILEEGAHLYYERSSEVFSFYDFLVKMRMDYGNKVEAESLRKKVDKIRNKVI